MKTSTIRAKYSGRAAGLRMRTSLLLALTLCLATGLFVAEPASAGSSGGVCDDLSDICQMCPFNVQDAVQRTYTMVMACVS